MLKKLISRTSTISEAAAVLAIASLISRLFGVLRDNVIATRYAGDVSDAYLAAFAVPDFVFNLVIVGALSSAFIPIFTEYLQKNGSDREEAWGIVNSLVNIGVVILAVVLLGCTIAAPALVHVVAPGFDPDKQEMVIVMMRVMFLSPLFFGLSNLAGGVLNSFKNFLAYSLAPILYNLGIIIGAIYLVPQVGYIGLAYGVVLGAFAHMLIQLPGVFSLGYKYRMKIHWDHPALKRIAFLMLPRTLGVTISQVNVIINMAIASFLGGGAVSVFRWADNLQSVPIGMFGVSLAVAVFPTLAEKYSLQKLSEFKADIVQVMRQITFFVVPTMMLFWLLRAQIVRLVLGYGVFDWEMTRFTISALAFFTFGMLAQSVIHLLARSFYALQDTRTPLLVSIASVLVNVGAALILVKYLNVVGLAAAISISAIFNAVILAFLLSKRLQGLAWREVLDIFWRTVLASLVMGGAGYGMLRAVDLIVNTRTVIGLLTQTVVTVIVCLLVYLVLAKWLKVPENELILKPGLFIKRKPPLSKT